MTAEQRRLKRQAVTVRSRRKRRMKALDLLGGRCCHCGYDDSRALQIDHKHGGGTAARMKDSRDAVSEVLKGKLKPYQLLCANCNWIKRAERGEYGRRKRAHLSHR